MLFAAGFGTRMGALTADRPKPLIAVAGRPLIDHALALTAGRGLRIVVNAHYLAAQITAHLARHPEITVLTEAPELLDTGGGLKHALAHLGPGPLFTLNTDAVWTGSNPLATLAAAWQPERMDALVLLTPRARAVGHSGKGDFEMDAEGRLSRGPGLIYTGCQILDPTRLAEIPDRIFSLNRFWDLLIAEGRLFGALHAGGWCDVGRPESLPLAETLLADV